jgi:thiosulfate dehydrogenase (quinone) large subunit
MTGGQQVHLDTMSDNLHDHHDAFKTDAALGYCLLRLTMGVNLLFHSFTRWGGMDRFVSAVVADFAHTPLPIWLVRAFAHVIPVWEPIVGALLVFGLFTRAALVAGALLIALLVFGTALRGDFSMLTEQMIYALIFFVLIYFRAAHDRFGADGWRAGS